jgi:hypothetical protein
MTVTEKEAGEKWCHITLGSKPSNCLATGCMAWRWSEYTPHVCDKCGTEETEWIDMPEQRRGFCGLSGVPKL